MPSKTIYVPDEKVTVFDKAVEIAGKNISPVIVTALERFVEEQGMKNAGFKELRLSVGRAGFERVKIFMGRMLVSHYYSKENQWHGVTVYETPKGFFVADIVDLPDPYDPAGNSQLAQAGGEDADPDYYEILYRSVVEDRVNRYDKGEFRDNPQFAYQGANVVVYKTIEELKSKAPEQLNELLKEALETRDNPVEYLDV
jgi:hypothetical protein